VAYLGSLGTGAHTTSNGSATLLLLMLGGPVTTVPLLFFGAAAKRLRLSTMGILQYLAPSLQFLLAVLAFGEPFSSVQLLSFACIWTAVLIYTLDALRAACEYRIEVVEPD
jgi:chloramphenicol-sensitive protein RarD